jgi:hypothetical protein
MNRIDRWMHKDLRHASYIIEGIQAETTPSMKQRRSPPCDRRGSSPKHEDGRSVNQLRL